MKIENKKIIMDKEINLLDEFVLDFIDVVKKHFDYVIVSGYVSILFGRSRTTEDIDMLIPLMDIEKFINFHNDALENGFYCLNSDNADELYNEYLNNDNAIRYARKDEMIPNMEFKIIKNQIDETALKDKIEAVLGDKQLFISNIEMQIVFKKEVLGSQKDLEDARHLEKVFDGKIDQDKIDEYRVLMKNDI